MKTNATPSSTTSLNAGKGRFLKKEALPPKKVSNLNTSLGQKSNRSKNSNKSKHNFVNSEVLSADKEILYTAKE